MDFQDNDYLQYNMSALFKGILTVMEEEDPSRALEVIAMKASTKLPKKLRHALGRSLLERAAERESDHHTEEE